MQTERDWGDIDKNLLQLKQNINKYFKEIYFRFFSVSFYLRFRKAAENATAVCS